MNFEDGQRDWEAHARKDPLFAILGAPGKENGGWNIDEFFRTGRLEVAEAIFRGRTDYDRPLDNRTALDFGCGVGRAIQAL